MVNCSGGVRAAGGEQEVGKKEIGRLHCVKRGRVRQERRTAPACHRQAGCYVSWLRNDAKGLGASSCVSPPVTYYRTD